MGFVLNLDNFQGPFDVLLDLLNKKKLSLTEISLSKITNDYLRYLSRAQIRLEDMHKFLYVAAKLTAQKSSALLKIQLEDTGDEELDLAESLISYKSIKESSAKLEIILNKSSGLISKRPGSNSNFMKLSTISIRDLTNYTAKEIDPREKKLELKNNDSLIRKTKMNLHKKLTELSEFEISYVINNFKNKTEAIIVFTAILEMIKSGKIKVDGEKLAMENSR